VIHISYPRQVPIILKQIFIVLLGSFLGKFDIFQEGLKQIKEERQNERTGNI